MKILAFHLHKIIEYTTVRGLIRADILNQMKEVPVDFLDERATVNSGDFYAALAYIDNQMKEELLGIRLANFLNLNALGLIYQISLQATTVSEALFYLQNYLEASFPLIEIKTDTEKSYISIQLGIKNEKDRLNRIILENVLTIIAKELDLMTDEKTIILKTSPYFSEAYPNDWGKDAFFSVKLKPHILKATLKRHLHLQLDLLVPAYIKLIEGLKTINNFSNQVKIASLNLAKPELPDLDTLADAFNLSPRTFQRRLSSENKTFREIVEDLKKQIANLLIRHDRFSIADISFILGYSEPAAFIHSFKKWHGDTPDKIRKSIQYPPDI